LRDFTALINHVIVGEPDLGYQLSNGLLVNMKEESK